MASLKRIEHKSGRVVYRIVISMGYDKQGKKLVKNLTYSVNQSTTPKQQEREAAKYAMDMEDKIKYGYEFDAERLSFEDFSYKWLDNIKDNIAYGTYVGYEQKLRDRIIPYFKGYKLAHIRTPHIEAFLKTLVNDYSSGTIRAFVIILNGIFKTAKRWGMIENNPCQDAERPKKKQENEKLRYFTPQQSLMFLHSLSMEYETRHEEHYRTNREGTPCLVKEHNRRYIIPTQYQVFFQLSLLCGFRDGETLALHWNDIDFSKREISIKRSLGMTEHGFDYKEPKTSTSIRTVHFPATLLPLLKKYRKEYAMLKFEHGTAWQGDDRDGGNLFTQANGKQMSHATPYQYFIGHLKRYNRWIQEHPEEAKIKGLEELPLIPLHGLRHSCATLLNILEVNIIDISKILGHSNCSITMNIYAHSFEEQERKASDKLNDFLLKNA